VTSDEQRVDEQRKALAMLETSRRRWLAAGGVLAVVLATGAIGLAATQGAGINSRNPLVPSSATNANATGGNGASVQRVAIITPDEAKRAALGVAPGVASVPDLDSDDGTVVFEVTVTGADGSETDVTVDAGNGSVLGQERDHDDDVAERAEEVPDDD
jgi:hypothetical protein